MPKKKTTKHQKRSELAAFADTAVATIPTSNLSLYRGPVNQDEAATILTDFVRQYVGIAEPQPTPGSGVIINQDLVWRTQSYNGLSGYDLYDLVEADPHVAGILATRALAVAGLKWQVEPASDDPRDQEIATKINDVLTYTVGFSQDLVELAAVHGKGFTVSEILWNVDADGFIFPEQLLNRPQRRIQFDAATRWPKIRKMSNAYFGDPVPPEKFIIHRNSQKYESPFGDPLDQKLFWMWLFKRFVTKFWMKHEEIAQGAVPIVQHPANASQNLKDEALDVAKNIQSGAYGAIPENFSILWAESKNALTSAEGYEKFIRFADDQMTKCVLGQTLTTEGSSSSGKGSQALGNVHNSVRMDYLQYDAKALADTLTTTLIRWMVNFNFADVRHQPRFSFLLEEAKDLQSQTIAIKNLSDAGYRVDPDYIEQELGIPLMKDDQGNVIFKTAPTPPQGPPNENDSALSSDPGSFNTAAA